MSIKPILFSGPMVRALLEGHKTQTRRIIPAAQDADYFRETDGRYFFGFSETRDNGQIGTQLPQLQHTPGDLLWVRETWTQVPYTAYRASDGIIQSRNPNDNHYAAIYKENFDRSGRPLWKPSIFMPKWASRITLEVTRVRVERLQDISEEDARAEGVEVFPYDGDDPQYQGMHGYRDYDESHPHHVAGYRHANDSFRSLWNSLNEKRGFGWDTNPWVSVTEFKVHKCNFTDLVSEATP